MSSAMDLSQLVPNAIGMLAYDENGQLIDSSGVGKQRAGDILELSKIELDDEGYGIVRDNEVEIILLKQGGKTLAVYRSYL
ncbi:HHL226Wp [Eremothecium sinecaudum]|uniref:HHL226Wp n=1 Tax=Eremothecium sinecaudum TaxID=45286 RepID=A0A0X8HVZ6_9SACH|nr:HHL226Wp [Eremothecium sinecaudum]AMD22544.1 HHL226Wp [Eremothecium sinecaudum]